MKKFFRSPWLEVNLMLAVLIISYIALALITSAAETEPGAMTGGVIFGWLFGFFFLSFAIALVAVIGGIGGGVLFTPVMLAFTPVDSLIVRATGLIVAMFSGLISTGPFMKGGLANLKICIFCAAAYGVGAFAGAFMTHAYMFVGMPVFALDYSILPIASTVVGGMGTLAGPAIGAVILVPLSEALRGLGTLRIVFYGLFLVVFTVAIPEGIFHYVTRKYHQFERWVKVEA